jgi:hypothetical protein
MHVREEVELLELPVLVGIFGVHANNHIRDLGIVADMSTQAPGALQEEAGVSPGLVLFHQDAGLLKVDLDVGSGLVELHPALIHQGHRILTSKYLCAPDKHPIVNISDNAVRMRGYEPAGETDGVVRLEASDLGDEDLDGGLFVRFLVHHPFPRKGRDGAVPVDGSSALGVVPVVVAHTDFEVHLLPLYRDLAGDEGVPALLRGDLHGLVDGDLDQSVVKTRMTSTADNLLGF